jgi:hypothetical protein
MTPEAYIKAFITRAIGGRIGLRYGFQVLCRKTKLKNLVVLNALATDI